jgi:hypothetical protein
MEQQQPRRLRVELGPIEIDWAKTIGYYGGIGAAIAAGIIEWPLALFIAGVPFYRMLQHPDASLPVQLVSAVLEGAALPVGGESDGTIQLNPKKAFPGSGSIFGRFAGGARDIWDDARRLAG